MVVSPLSELRYTAMELVEEEQASGLLCPFCRGGDSNERSLSVRRSKGKAFYTCHRVSCGKQGTVMLGLFGKPAEDRSVHRARRAVQNLRSLPDNIREILKKRYYMHPLDIARLEAQWSEDYQRMWMPIYSFTRRIASGGVLRTFNPTTKPKTLTFIDNFDRPSQAWYRNWSHGSKNILIVEDQLSACRAANTTSSVALLGTNLGLDGVLEMVKLEPEQVVLCLDKDALKRGLELQNKWGGMFKKLTIASPERDLKDMPPDKLNGFVHSIFDKWD